MRNVKRMLAVLLAVLMLLPSVLIPGLAAGGYSDVPDNAWYAKAVAYVTEHGYMNGVSETEFAPGVNVNRGMFVTVLARVAGVELNNNQETAFADVPEGKFYTGAVAWAAEKGIVNGVSETSFAPTANITRQDLCTILARFLNVMQYDLPVLENKTFSDSKRIASYAKSAVQLCAETGLVSGYDDGTFRPKGKATRAQVAVIIMRLDLALNGEPVDPVPMPAQEFNGAAGEDMSVAVNAPEGALPENTNMTVSRVTDEAALAAIQEKVNGAVYAAADISFSKDGTELEPAAAVEVQISLEGLEALENPVVVHIKDDGTVEYVNAELISITRGRDKVLRFYSMDFSVYAIIGGDDDVNTRATVNFYGADGAVTATYYVKEADELAEIKQFVTDPGAGTLGDHKVFKGWYIDVVDNNNDGPNYLDTTEPKTIDQVCEYLAGLTSIPEGMEISVYPMIFNAWTLTYLDEKGAAFETVALYTKGNSLVYHVSQTYSPRQQNENFDGWMKMEYKNGELIQVGENVVVPADGGDLTIDADTYLEAYVPEGHWLVYNENGKGATFVAAAFVKSGENTEDPGVTMTRRGYEFGGWYYGKKVPKVVNGQTVVDAEGNPVLVWALDDTYANSFSFGDELEEDTYIYAKWDAHKTAGYTIIIWKQKVSGQGYDFERSITNLTGTVGEEINTVSQVNSGDSAYARINNTSYQYTGFHLESYDQNVVIKPEGSSVLNVYYNRTEYTLTFQDHPYTVTTSGSGTQYALIDGQYVQLTRYGNNNYWYNGERYYGTRYTQGNGWTTVKEIKALYEQNISSNFPIVGSNGATYDNGERWDPQSNTPYSEVLIFIDVMPRYNVTFHLDVADRTTKTIHYYVEILPGETAERTYNGKGFKLYNEIDAQYSFFTEAEDYIDLVGFTKGGNTYPPVAYNNNGQQLNSVWNNGNARHVYCYYTRNVCTINFTDGKYVDGGGLDLGEESTGSIHVADNIAYQDDVSSYNSYKPTEIPDGYVFECWCVDNTCSKEFDFTTMPEGGIIVYAKWRQIQYRVFLHPNAGTGDAKDQSLDWGNESQAMNFRVSYGDKVANVTGTRLEYDFIGWYLDDGTFDEDFVPTIQVLNESLPMTTYNKQTDYTDKMNKWGEVEDPKSNSDLTGWNHDDDENTPGLDRFWITEKLDIYAKWSAKLHGAKGIDLVYDAGMGTNAPTDPIQYGDNTDVVVSAASTPPEGYVFSHWVVQKWNGSAFGDTDQTVVPGATFKARKVDAKVEDVTGPDDEESKFKYTIQLKAVYAEKPTPQPTHIYWYANNGTELNNGAGERYISTAVHNGETTTELAVNEAVPIPTPGESGTFIGESNGKLVWAGREFLGWARIPANDSGHTEPDLTEADLWLKWDAESNKYFVDVNYGKRADPDWKETSQVAADEVQPFDDLYAVWGNAAVFYVVHSSSGIIEAVRVPTNTETVSNSTEASMKGKVDLTAFVPDGYLYGGYYSVYGGVSEETVSTATASYYAKNVNGWTAGQTSLTGVEAKLDLNAAGADNFKEYDGSSMYLYNAEDLAEDEENVRFWIKANAYGQFKVKVNGVIAEHEDDKGSELTAKKGYVYYLKEVPDTYLHAKFAFIYNVKVMEENPEPGTEGAGNIEHIYLLTAADDALYSKVGFRTVAEQHNADAAYAIAEVTKGILTPKFVVIQRECTALGIDEKPTEITADSAFKLNGYLCVLQCDELIAQDFTMLPSWETLDGVVIGNAPLYCDGTATNITVSEEQP